VECQWLTSLSAGDGLQIFRQLNQCESAGDGLALNRLALARNGCGLQVYNDHTNKHDGSQHLLAGVINKTNATTNGKDREHKFSIFTHE